MRAIGALLVIALVTSSVGCSLGLSPRPENKDTAGAGPGKLASAGPTEPPRPLAGVDTSALDSSRTQTFWEVANRLYAPCPAQAVTLVQCIEEKRDCDTCTPAANLLVSQVKKGAAKAQAAAAVSARFGGENIREVSLMGSPMKGPDNAPVTIVVFSDFQCPACKATLPLLEELLASHPNDVRLVHKFYPLKKHTRAKAASYAAIAAMKQGKYWEMERLIFQNQEALSDQDLESYAQKLNLDVVRYRDDASSPTTRDLVERDIEAGDSAGLLHTPFVLINGRVFDPGYFRYDRDLESWVETEVQMVRARNKAAAAPPAPTPKGPDAPPPMTPAP